MCIVQVQWKYTATKLLVKPFCRSCGSQLPAAHTLNPPPIALHGGEVVIAVCGDENNVLDTYAADTLILRKYVVVDVLRVAHRSKQVRREVNAGLDSLLSPRHDQRHIHTGQRDTATHDDHALLEREPQAQVSIEVGMAEALELDRVIHLGPARARDVVHVHAETVSNAVREERGAHT